LYKLNDPKCKWDWCLLGENPMITWDIVEAYPDKPWNWRVLSRNPNITWDIVQANPNKPWNWLGLSMNPSITWDVVQTNPHKPWDWWGLSMKIHHADPRRNTKRIRTRTKKTDGKWAGYFRIRNNLFKGCEHHWSQLPISVLYGQGFAVRTALKKMPAAPHNVSVAGKLTALSVVCPASKARCNIRLACWMLHHLDIMPYYQGSAESIAKHIQWLCGAPTHETVCCVFPDAGDSVRELEVVEALLALGWTITHVWLMTTETIPDTPTCARMSTRYTVQTFPGYREVASTLQSIASEKSSIKEFLLPGIHQMHVSYTIHEGLNICSYFAICRTLHSLGVVKHGYINFVSIPPGFLLRTTPPWMSDSVIQGDEHVYMSSWASRLAFEVGQLKSQYPQLEVPLFLMEVGELHPSSINKKHSAILAQYSSDRVLRPLDGGRESTCGGLPDPVQP
jgi:hypothetical protein